MTVKRVWFITGAGRGMGVDIAKAAREGIPLSPTVADRWRLFIALPLPPPVAAAVVEALAPDRRRFPTARWISADALHLTLVFLGSTDAVRTPEIVTAIDAVARGARAIDLELGGGGGRARRDEDGVAWLGMAHGGTDTLRLARLLAESVAPLDVGDRRGPRGARSAHVTVARRASAALVSDPGFCRGVGPPIRWRADRIVLFRSLLERQGARYEALHTGVLRP